MSSVSRGLNRKHLAYTGAAVAIIGVTAIQHTSNYTIGALSARTFYVSPAGNDSGSGQTTGAAFRTIGRCAAVMIPGDTCAVLAGTYHETVTPAADGTATQPITYTTYQGAAVTIDGADPITTWVSGPQSAYTATVALPVSGYRDTGFWANQVFVDGTMLQEARYPQDTGTLLNPSDGRAATGSGPTHIADMGLTFPADTLQGATVSLRGGFAFSAQTRTIDGNTPAVGGTAGGIDFPDTSTCGTAGKLGSGPGTRYFVSGLPNTRLLTYAGAWAYTPATTTLFVRLPADANPGGHTVEAKQRMYAFDLSARSHIIVDGFSLFASTITTTVTSHDNTLENLTVTYPSHFVSIPSTPDGCPYTGHTFESGIVLSGTHELLQGSTITRSAGDGAVADGTAITVTNNLMHDIDYSASYAVGVQLRVSQGITVTHNTIYNTGRDGIKMGAFSQSVAPPGNTTVISSNLIYNWAMMTQDSGGFYTCCSIDGAAVSVDHNWIHDSQSGSEIDDVFGNASAGVYVDNGGHGFLVHHNVVYNAQYGLEYNSFGGTSHDNHSYNNTLPSLLGQGMSTNGDTTGSVFQNNIAPQNWTGGVTADHNLAVNPAYVDAANHNYALAPTASNALDKGTPISGVTPAGDTHPDIGAYDHAEPLWVPGCTLGGLCNDPASPGLVPTP